ncbi:MAG: hypothetical protein JNK97_14125 [Zoogloea sp.]|nr:hypothetical protein [Zoogloea sp.]
MTPLRTIVCILLLSLSSASFAAIVPWRIVGHVQNNTGTTANDFHFTLNLGTGSGFGGYVGSVSPFSFINVQSNFRNNSFDISGGGGPNASVSVDLSNPANSVQPGGFADFNIPFSALDLANITISDIYWTSGSTPGSSGTRITAGRQPTAAEIRVAAVSTPNTLSLLSIGAIAFLYRRTNRQISV